MIVLDVVIGDSRTSSPEAQAEVTAMVRALLVGAASIHHDTVVICVIYGSIHALPPMVSVLTRRVVGHRRLLINWHGRV